MAMQPAAGVGEEASVRRIVSLAPSDTEIAYALGLGPRVVGVCDDSDWPHEARAVAKVGMDLQIDAERVAALEPDLVLASLSVPGMEKCVDAVRSRGLKTLVLDPKTLSDVMLDILEVGRVVDVEDRAKALVAQMRARLINVESSVEGQPRVRVYWEWWPRPLITPGRKSWMVDILRIAGGEMLFEEIEKESSPILEDQVLSKDPEAVVLCWCGTLQRKQDPARVMARPGWQRVKAVASGRVYGADEGLFGRPGPRLVEGAEWLAKILHPGAA